MKLIDHCYNCRYFTAICAIALVICTMRFPQVPYNTIFEVLFFVWTLFHLRNKLTGKSIITFFTIVTCYFIGSLIFSVFINNDGLKDFLMIFKVFIYMFSFMIMGDEWQLKKKTFIILFDVLILSFFLKYIIDYFILGYSRPTLFYENNYELMLLAMLYHCRLSIDTTHKHLYTGGIAIVFLLSGSRVGGSILLFILVYHYFVYFSKYRILFITVALILLGIIGNIFIVRFKQYDIGTSVLDRHEMLLLFFEEIRDWNIGNYFFGTLPVTPLSAEVGSSFSFFKKLFSFSDPDLCYSVVFHSFILRTIYDHGLVGLLFIVGFFHFLLIRKDYSNKDSFVINGIVLLNSCSVSGYNSIYFAIAFLFIISVEHTRFQLA